MVYLSAYVSPSKKPSVRCSTRRVEGLSVQHRLLPFSVHCGVGGHWLGQSQRSDDELEEFWGITMVETRAPVQRPISPHLQIYRLTATMVMSGLHRLSGMSLYFGSVLLVWWLIAVASGPNAYATVQWLMGTLIGRLVLLGFSWALIHHALGGVRHLIWDTVHGLEPNEREWLARATIVGSLGLTAILWIIGYMIGGVVL
jgi:succinate dehydrogenase / fumarate reductase, cytochrome b subunit